MLGEQGNDGHSEAGTGH